MGRRVLIVGGVAVVAVAALVYWLTRPDAVPVRLAVVHRGEVQSTVANTRAGTIMACQRARMSPATGGTIDDLPVTEGDTVVAEEILPAGAHTVEVAVLDEAGNGSVYLRDLEFKRTDLFYIGVADLTLSPSSASGPVTSDWVHSSTRCSPTPMSPGSVSRWWSPLARICSCRSRATSPTSES